jgi:hypothetical protein
MSSPDLDNNDHRLVMSIKVLTILFISAAISPSSRAPVLEAMLYRVFVLFEFGNLLCKVCLLQPARHEWSTISSSSYGHISIDMLDSMTRMRLRDGASSTKERERL